MSDRDAEMLAVLLEGDDLWPDMGIDKSWHVRCLVCGRVDGRTRVGGLRCHDCEEDGTPLTAPRGVG